MDNIIIKLNEYENDIKLLKNAILVLETNFTKIKKDIININKKENKKKPKNVKNNIEKNVIKKTAILSNKVKMFFNIDIEDTNNNEILISKINKKINEYLVNNDLIKNKKIYLNKELKKLLNTKKRIIVLDNILNTILNQKD